LANVFCIKAILRLATKNCFCESSQRLIQPRLVRWGDRQQALTWLEKACSDRDVWAVMMKVDPIFADVRTDPWFVALLRRVGLE